MAALAQNSIAVTVRDRAKWTKIWSKKTNIFKKFNFFLKKNQNGRFDQKCYLGKGERYSELTIWDHKGNTTQITNIFKNSKFYKKKI